MGLGNETNLDELKVISTDKDSVFVVEDYDLIARSLDSMATKICEGTFQLCFAVHLVPVVKQKNKFLYGNLK